MAKVTTNVKNWDFNSQHVQQNLTGGDFVGSHTVIVCATAPRASDLAATGASGTGSAAPAIPNFYKEASAGSTQGGYAIPLGVVSDFTVNQNRQLQQIFELGSKRSYFLTARNLTSLSLSRVFFNGPSLLRMLYAYYPHKKLGAGAGNELKDRVNCADTKISPIAYNEDGCNPLPEIKTGDLAGYDNFFINLASSLFSQPVGLIMYVKNNAGRDMGAVFFEECNVEAHQMGMSQGSVVIGEGVQIRCDRILPIRVQVNTDPAAAADAVTSTLPSAGGSNAIDTISDIYDTATGIGDLVGFDTAGLIGGLF